MTATRATLPLILALTVLLTASGCGKTVERIDTDETRDLSGRWNDTDSRLVAEEMIADALARPWLENHREETGDRPTVIIGEVRNLSHEHINTRTFINDLQRELINSGRVEFVASSEQREAVREERADQDLHASPDTRKAMGEELGADYMLLGSINTIIDQEGREQVRFYQVDLEMISLADNRKVWMGQKKLKKYVEGASLRP
ncbi:MAG: penicillin-binding protein activator LpoB [Pseudomonadota bacterium]